MSSRLTNNEWVSNLSVAQLDEFDDYDNDNDDDLIDEKRSSILKSKRTTWLPLHVVTKVNGIKKHSFPFCKTPKNYKDDCLIKVLCQEQPFSAPRRCAM
jgi:hypothetical protein